jgi:hypothetical protein
MCWLFFSPIEGIWLSFQNDLLFNVMLFTNHEYMVVCIVAAPCQILSRFPSLLKKTKEKRGGLYS